MTLSATETRPAPEPTVLAIAHDGPWTFQRALGSLLTERPGPLEATVTVGAAPATEVRGTVTGVTSIEARARLRFADGRTVPVDQVTAITVW